MFPSSLEPPPVYPTDSGAVETSVQPESEFRLANVPITRAWRWERRRNLRGRNRRARAPGAVTRYELCTTFSMSILGSKNATVDCAHFLARYMARSACRSSVSVVVPSSGINAAPIATPKL